MRCAPSEVSAPGAPWREHGPQTWGYRISHAELSPFGHFFAGGRRPVAASHAESRSTAGNKDSY